MKSKFVKIAGDLVDHVNDTGSYHLFSKQKCM